MVDATCILEVRSLRKFFPIRSKGPLRRQVGQVKAVNDVSFCLRGGEALGLVGESGCGKTTLARTLLRALKPTAGEVLFRHNGSLLNLAGLSGGKLKPLRRRIQMIFQDPFSSLNPRMTVGQIVGEPLAVHRQGGRQDRARRVTEMLRKVGMGPEHLRRYPHEFSGGQRQRIGIARSLILNPALVVADEPVSALDVSVQAQIINLLADLQRELNLTYIFIAHDLSVVRHLCNRVAVMYAGRIVEIADRDSLFDAPKHPYTQALIAAVPSPDPNVKMGTLLPGEVANPADLPPGCAFHPRCPKRFGPCDQACPGLSDVGEGHRAACHLWR